MRPQTVLTDPGDSAGDTEPLRRSYNGLEVVARRQFRDRWMMQASYIFGDGEGNVPNNFGGSAYVDYTNPNALVNRFGDLLIGPRHQVKLYGSYEAKSRGSS